VALDVEGTYVMSEGVVGSSGLGWPIEPLLVLGSPLCSLGGFVIYRPADEGISPSRMTTRRFGEQNPVASNETAAGRAENRRAEVVVR